MTGYIFIAFILLVTAYFSIQTNFAGKYPSFEVILSSVNIIMLLVVPILTMRCLAEERNSKTDQLLYSLPVSVPKIILAKYLAMCTVFLIAVGVMALYPLILSIYGTVYFLNAYSAIFGFYLLGCSLIAIGMFMSSLTESQIISAVLSFGILFFMFLMTSITSMLPSTSLESYVGFAVLILALALLIYYMMKNYWVAFTAAALGEVILAFFYFTNRSAFEGSLASFMGSLALFDRIDTFIYGIFDLASVIYYISVIAVFIFLSIQSVEKRRWS
jgi:ABC-2 type transport system permease protein